MQSHRVTARTCLIEKPAYFLVSNLRSSNVNPLLPGARPELSLGAGPKGRRQRAGVRFLGRGNNPLPTSYGVWGSAVSSPAGFGAEPRPPKGFPLFSALRMASPDTIIFLIVDYHAAIRGQDPRSPTRVRP